MAGVKLSTFSGLLPQVSSRLLPEEHATIAENARFSSGRLSPLRSNVNANDHNNVAFTVPAATTTIYRHRDRQGNGYWLAWNQHIHAAPSPIAEDPFDRLYWTGEAFPRMSIGTEVAASINPAYDPSASRKLGIPAPAAAPTTDLTTDGTSSDTPLSRSYVYTWVSGLGEEGQPSPASLIIDAKQGATVTLTFSEAVPSYIFNTGGQPARRYIYRTNVNGEFQFVGSALASAATFVDSVLDENLGEIIPSGNWDAPPDESLGEHPDGPLLGLTSMQNGMLAGFAGRSVFFADSFLPHAWPKGNSLTVKSKIVGLASISIGLIVLTQGKPVLMTGSSPSSMGATEIDNDQACVSARSIVDMGEVAMYASPDGLVAAGEQGVTLVTSGVFSRSQWQALKPESINAYKYEGRYVFFYDTGTVKGGYILNTRSETPELVALNFHAIAGYNDPLEDALYLVVIEGGVGRVKKFDDGTPLTYTWQSKEFRIENPINPGCAKIDAESYPIQFTLIADGQQRHAQSVANGRLFRLPAGYRANTFQVRVSGTGDVNQIIVGETSEDLAQ
jgi:hypothetical protein